MIIKNLTIKFIVKISLKEILIINGNKITNSTSKTRKTKEIKKNRIENGSRALNIGVNPHSNGDIFSS
jgi:hypothetical protein